MWVLRCRLVDHRQDDDAAPDGQLTTAHDVEHAYHGDRVSLMVFLNELEF